MATKRAKSLNDLYAQVQRMLADVPEITDRQRAWGHLTPEQERADKVLMIYHRYAQNISNAMRRKEAPVSGTLGTKDARYYYSTYKHATKAGSNT